MDETQSNGQGGSVDWGAWTAARLGRAIDVAIDREVVRPAVIVDPSQAYGVDEYGNVYPLGQYNPAMQQPAGRRVNPLMLLGLIAFFIVVSKH